MCCPRAFTRCAILDCGIRPGVSMPPAPDSCCGSNARQRPAGMHDQPRQQSKRLPPRSLTLGGWNRASALAARNGTSFASAGSIQGKQEAHDTSPEEPHSCPVRMRRSCHALLLRGPTASSSHRAEKLDAPAELPRSLARAGPASWSQVLDAEADKVSFRSPRLKFHIAADSSTTRVQSNEVSASAKRRRNS